MQYTPNYNLIIAEGSDAVNPLTQIFPNFTAIDGAMEDNKEHGVTTASEVTTGGVHAIVRVDSSVPVFRFTATSAWTTGDTMTLDGSAVTVHLADGTAPKSGAYVIGAEVLAIVNGSLVTLMTGASFDGVTSFNSRQGIVTPQSGDYTANMIGYNNTTSGLAATDIQGAIDEVEDQITNLPTGGGTNYETTEEEIGTYNGVPLYRKSWFINVACPNNVATQLCELPAGASAVKIIGKIGNTLYPNNNLYYYVDASNYITMIQTISTSTQTATFVSAEYTK